MYIVSRKFECFTFFLYLCTNYVLSANAHTWRKTHRTRHNNEDKKDDYQKIWKKS